VVKVTGKICIILQKTSIKHKNAVLLYSKKCHGFQRKHQAATVFNIDNNKTCFLRSKSAY